MHAVHNTIAATATVTGPVIQAGDVSGGITLIAPAAKAMPPTPAAFAAAHGDPKGWSPADYETYDVLSHL